MIARKKIEIIIESIKVPKIVEILEGLEVPGYTIVGSISGKGVNGVLDHNCKAKVFENTYMFTVCDEEMVDDILKPIYDILHDFSGACFVSDIRQMNVEHEEEFC